MAKGVVKMMTYRTTRNTGPSAAISVPSKRDTPRVDIVGFREISLFQLIRCTGLAPLTVEDLPEESIMTLESLQKRAKSKGRPLLIFPEGTTSNGRGLLRFASVFKGIQVPVKDFPIFIMCVR